MKAAVQYSKYSNRTDRHRPHTTAVGRRSAPTVVIDRHAHSFTPRRLGHFLSSQVVPWTYEANIPDEPSGSWRQSLQQVVGVLTLIGTLAAQYLARHAISRDAGKTLDSILLEGPS